MKNITFIKKIVALETVKTLYAMGHIDDEFRPTVRNVKGELSDPQLFPHWVNESEDIKAGSSDCYRVVPINVSSRDMYYTLRCIIDLFVRRLPKNRLKLGIIFGIL